MNDDKKNLKLLQSLKSVKESILIQLHKVIVGQDEVIEQILIALFSNGHCLIEGVPGLAKTLMISSLSKILDLKFSRIQFTPDLMPSDITGTEILVENKETGQREFKYIKGPVFSNFILADEINRTPPKTQSALLQAMQEYEVTAGNDTFKLEPPFLVLATQNPIEQEGTYPLPEAQLDRFMFHIVIDYPDFEQEKDIVKQSFIRNNTIKNKDNTIQSVISKEQIISIQQAINDIPVNDHVIDFAVKLVRASRPKANDGDSHISPVLKSIKEKINWGAGPRASQFLVIAAKTRAILNGRLTPSVDDVIAVSHIVLRHRILISYSAEADGLKSTNIIDQLINEINK
ncbi:MAG: MoxR family ATPase [Candidatus Cloacimonetes bacterium]|jgi:MoxR-like ATPase|nr:MoxR family ATPase [Candidatus Cloacimonadota bacterium]